MNVNEVIHALYQERSYPAMSHPLSDPAVTAVAAMMSGLAPPDPRGARILEIGCSSGHNLIPLALRWKESRFTGIDISRGAVLEASQHAAVAGATNVRFQACDLREFVPEGQYDYIIAHGVFSWVPDDAKKALMELCRNCLSQSGVATISFNVEAGWRARFPVVEKIRAIQQAGADDEVVALRLLKSLLGPEDPELEIVDDMLAKGLEILPFDDFAPVNDPWSVERFSIAAATEGLRWLGESDAGRNLPAELEEDELLKLKKRARDGVDFQDLVDEAAKRTFRSGLICRADAPVKMRMAVETPLEFSLRLGEDNGRNWIPELEADVAARAPSCVPVWELWAASGPEEEAGLGRLVAEGISKGRLKARIEPVIFSGDPPEFPTLDAFRLFCAREGLPLVDVWHKPCSFPAGHYPVLAAMDGTKDIAALAAFSKSQCPELDFSRWLRHLAGRGMFT